MTHEEFRQAWGKGQLVLNVNRSEALRLNIGGFLPKPYFYAINSWAAIWLGLILAGPIVAYFYQWWAGLACWVFATFLFGAIKQSACQNVIEYARENKDFYNAMVERSILQITQK